jgi:SAM-dependent methyltransferase
VSDHGVHRSAAVGFERAADVYERGRPDFPAEAVAFMAERLGLGPATTLVELGPGTGKLTRLLAPSGARIVGIEPVAAMREELLANVPGIEAIDAVAEDLPLEDRSGDAAIAAQAFHWFDGDRALVELARVLRDDGGLALVWNVRDEDVTWVRAISDLIEPFRGDTPSHRATRWMGAFDRTDAFTPPVRASFGYDHHTTPDRVVDRVLSISFVAALPDDERLGVADGVRLLLASDPATAAREEIVFPYRTDVWICRRRARRRP